MAKQSDLDHSFWDDHEILLLIVLGAVIVGILWAVRFLWLSGWQIAGFLHEMTGIESYQALLGILVLYAVLRFCAVFKKACRRG